MSVPLILVLITIAASFCVLIESCIVASSSSKWIQLPLCLKSLFTYFHIHAHHTRTLDDIQRDSNNNLWIYLDTSLLFACTYCHQGHAKWAMADGNNSQEVYFLSHVFPLCSSHPSVFLCAASDLMRLQIPGSKKSKNSPLVINMMMIKIIVYHSYCYHYSVSMFML